MKNYEKFPNKFTEKSFYQEIQGSGKENLAIIGAIHGNERIGIEVIKELLQKNEFNEKSFNKLYLIGGNPRAYAENKRFTEANLNRCFGDENDKSLKHLENSYERAIAKEIQKILRKCHRVLDIHQSRSKDNFIVCKKGSLDLAKKMNAKMIIISPELEHYDDPEGISVGSTDKFVDSIGQKGIVYEFGDMHAPDQTENIKNAYQESLNFIHNKPREKSGSPEIIETIFVYRTKINFILDPAIKQFSILKQGQTIGTDGDNIIKVQPEHVGHKIYFAKSEKNIGQEAFFIGRSLSK